MSSTILQDHGLELCPCCSRLSKFHVAQLPVHNTLLLSEKPVIETSQKPVRTRSLKPVRNLSETCQKPFQK